MNTSQVVMGQIVSILSTHLAYDVPVGEADNHPILGCVVLVLVLNNQALSGKVISFSL